MRQRRVDCTTPTKQRLGAALRMIGQPEMADRAVCGYYDELESQLPDPLAKLDEELTNIATHGAIRVRARLREGAFDATTAEINTWMAQAEPKLLEQILARK